MDERQLARKIRQLADELGALAHAGAGCLDSGNRALAARDFRTVKTRAFQVATAAAKLDEKLDCCDIAAQIELRGPDRVMVDQHCSEPIDRARAKGVEWRSPGGVVFARNDRWTLAAPESLAQMAFNFWSEQWLEGLRVARGRRARIVVSR